jgi:hypothetical protein
MVHLPTRPGITMALFERAVPGADATIVLIPGGTGGFGKIVAGRPTSGNFLIRSLDLFLQAGFNVIALGKPSDRADLDGPTRLGSDHRDDLRAVIAHAATEFGKPVWLVGTSMGTVSAAAAAIDQGDGIDRGIAGLVLTASLTARSYVGALPTQDLAAIRVPVLVVHHQGDDCRACNPYEVPAIIDALRNAPIRESIMMTGGGPAEGHPCEAFHWHGFVGVEGETVARIAAWMRARLP